MRTLKVLIYLSVFSLMLFAFSADKSSTSLNLIVFQGSDWCSNCIRFDKNVLQSDAFKSYISQNHIELILVDFPQKKELSKKQQTYNDSIAERFHFDGSFPTIVLSKSDVSDFQELDYVNQSANEIIEQLEQKKALF